MLTDETLKALIEAIIYVAPEPVSLNALAKALEEEERDRIKAQLEILTQEFEQASHGIEVRHVAGGYRFSSKPEHHEVLRKFVKTLKPLVRLSKPALETLAVIAYRQPVTVPEIEEIRGVDCGGVIHTLLEKKLVVTAGRKNVVGRPILYRTSKEFLVHFGLKDTSELPSLKEFEELARQALGSDLPADQEQQASLRETEGLTIDAEVPPRRDNDPGDVAGSATPIPIGDEKSPDDGARVEDREAAPEENEIAGGPSPADEGKL